jgi:Cu+-exporting ATPase
MYEIYTGTGSGYLDSMSGIVFFMLVGRWLQDRTYQTISFDRDFRAFFPIAVNVLKNNTIESVPVDRIKPNDVIQIHHEELIPVDAILSKGNAEIDYSFVTGESLPVNINKGEIIYAGGKQTGGIIELLVVKEVSQSYLTNLWNKESLNNETTTSYSFIDALSKYFTYIVLAIGTVAGGYWLWQGQTQLMWNALTTILIVACPCALLLSANFTRGNILRILSLNKFYLKNANVIESLARINTIVFDKTGTLTQNNKMKVRYEGQILTPALKTQIASLLVHSNHPLSKAVLSYLDTPASLKG